MYLMSRLSVLLAIYWPQRTVMQHPLQLECYAYQALLGILNLYQISSWPAPDPLCGLSDKSCMPSLRNQQEALPFSPCIRVNSIRGFQGSGGK